MMKSRIICILLLLAGASGIYTQGLTVTGKVVDNEGLEVIGENVTMKGKQNTGTTTNINGKYTTTVGNPQKDVLVFSFIGLENMEVVMRGRKQIGVTMKAASVLLDEVVVIGYATVERKNLIGSVASVRNNDSLKVPSSDVTQTLAGRMADVQIIQTDGQPDATMSVRVRGSISITQSNELLYIIDGFPTEDGMSSLDPAGIESIDVLKDVSATAIYGARGANGVMVITTKNGAKSEGKTTLTPDSYVGVRTPAKRLDVSSVEEFVLADCERTLGDATDPEESMWSWQNRYGGFVDLHENYGNRKGIDRLDRTMGRTTVTQNHRVGVNGSNDRLNCNMSYGYSKDEGAMVYSGSDKHNIALSVKSEVNKRLFVTGRVNFDYLKVYGADVAGNGTNKGGSNVDAKFNKMVQILQYRPTIGIRGSDPNLLAEEDPVLSDADGNVMQNLLIAAAEEKDNKETRTLQANGGLTFKIIKGLTSRNNTGMRHQLRRRELFYGDQSTMGRRNGIYGSIRNMETGSFQTSNVLTYDKRFQKKHEVVVRLGQEFIRRWTRVLGSGVSGLPTDEFILGDMSLSTPSVASSDENYDDNLLSLFARLNYDFTDKYLLSATFRAGGSSKFGKNNKWGYFSAVSTTWRVGEEDFIKKLSVLPDLKSRIGYGLAGNNRIGSYNGLALMSSTITAMGDQLTPGYASKQIPSPDLKWEVNKTFSMGVDLGFLSQRIIISPEFYINRSSNLLLNARLPYSSGYQSMLINAGETKNVGVELTVNTANFPTKEFSWNTTLTLSHNKNSVKALIGEAVQLYETRSGSNQNTHRITVGEPLGRSYGCTTEGLYQVDDFNYDASTQTYTLKDGIPYHGDKGRIRPGMWKFKNLAGDDNVIDENDKTVIGNAQPKFYEGSNGSFTYKGSDLSASLTFSYGGEVLNATKLVTSKVGSLNYNVLDVMNSSNRWMTINSNGQKVTDPGELAALNAGKTVAAYHDAQQGDNYIHSWAVEDTSYLKLSNVTLGYAFPKNLIARVGLKNLRLYATGNNLLTWTKYSGFDPEVSAMKNGLTPGVDSGAYSLSRSFILGLSVVFQSFKYIVIMKKIRLLYAVFALLATGFSSCEDLLTEEPNSKYDRDRYFDPEDKTEMAVMRIYSSLSDFNHYGWYEMASPASDDTYYTAHTQSDNQVHDIAHCQLNSTNTWIESIWKLRYEGIDRANLTVDEVCGMTGYAENTRLRALEAEARFLRAFLAFDLVKYWGDVPFKTSYSSSYESAFDERVDREVIYDEIISDLTFTKNNLDWATASSSPERVTQGATRALLMRVYLQRAGYSLQLNRQLKRPEDSKRMEYFDAVMEEWEAFEKKGYHDFYDGGYKALFKSYSQGVLNNKEGFWEIALYHSQGRRNGGAWGVYNGPQVTEPTGVSVPESSQYMGRANGLFIVVPEWRNFFEASDKHHDVTIYTYRYTWNGIKKKHVKEEKSADSWHVRKWRRKWMPKESWNKNINYADVNYCPLRYADMVLMVAEAYDEMGTGKQKAWDSLNSARTRAEATFITEANYDEMMSAQRKTHNLTFIDDSTSEGKFHTTLYWERSFELAFKGQRKYDLIRWGVLGKTLKLFGEISSVNQKENRPYPAYRNFTEGKHKLFPIPLKEIQSNPKLNGTNNDGY